MNPLAVWKFGFELRSWSPSYQRRLMRVYQPFGMTNIRKIKTVIVAGGRGTRLGDLTVDIPKPLVTVGERSILEHLILQLRTFGLNEILLATGHLGHVIEERLGDGRQMGVSVTHVRENSPQGSAGCLRPLRDWVSEDFLVIYADVFQAMDLARLVDFHLRNHSRATLVVHPNNHPHDSDIVVAREDGAITDLLCKKNPRPRYFNNLVNAGVHILNRAVFQYLPETGMVDLVGDLLPTMLQAGEPLFAYRTGEYLKDMGTPPRLEEVRVAWSNGQVQARSWCAPAQPAIFLDRDGTLIEYVPLAHTLEHIQLYPWSVSAIRTINRAGIACFLVTNQPVVARNLCTLEDIYRAHDKIETLLGEGGAFLDDIRFCPHHPDGGFAGENPIYKIRCTCRKPGSDMIEDLANRYNIDLESSWFIGDSSVDIMTGRNAGMKSLLVETGEGGRDGRCALEPDRTCSNLETAVTYALRRIQERMGL